jgi:hypothetical protein
VRVVAGRTERGAHVADEFKAGELVEQGKTLAATLVVLGERAAGRAAMQEVRGDRDISHGGDVLGRVTLDVGKSEQLAEDHGGRPQFVALRPGQKRRHRVSVEDCDADIESGHG